MKHEICNLLTNGVEHSSTSNGILECHILTPDAHKDPHKIAHLEILYEEHARVGHAIDVLLACRRI